MKCFVLFALSAKSHVCRVLPCLGWCERFKTMGKCVFSNLWLQKSPYKECLREVKGDKQKARCIVCMKDVDISSMGESALTSHLKGKKHQTLTSQKRSSASVPDFFGVSSQRPVTKSDDAKVVSKSASS